MNLNSDLFPSCVIGMIHVTLCVVVVVFNYTESTLQWYFATAIMKFNCMIIAWLNWMDHWYCLYMCCVVWCGVGLVWCGVVCVSVCLCVCASVCLSVCMSVFGMMICDSFVKGIEVWPILSISYLRMGTWKSVHIEFINHFSSSNQGVLEKRVISH